MSANCRFFFALSIAALIVTGVIAAPQRLPGLAHTTSLLGTGHGIDHVVIAVRDLEEATRAYTDMLGFAVVHGGSFPGGLRNSAVLFGASLV